MMDMNCKTELKRWQVSTGLSIAEMARRLGIKRSTLSRKLDGLLAITSDEMDGLACIENDTKAPVRPGASGQMIGIRPLIWEMVDQEPALYRAKIGGTNK